MNRKENLLSIQGEAVTVLHALYMLFLLQLTGTGHQQLLPDLTEHLLLPIRASAN